MTEIEIKKRNPWLEIADKLDCLYSDTAEYVYSKDVDMNVVIDKKYCENIKEKENLLSFFNVFIPAIDVNESEKKNFSAGGRFLIATIAHILQHSTNQSINI